MYLIILHATVIRPLTSHPYIAGMEHAGFSPDQDRGKVARTREHRSLLGRTPRVWGFCSRVLGESIDDSRFSLIAFSESFVKMQPSFKETLAEKKYSVLHRTKHIECMGRLVRTFSASKCLVSASRCFALVRSAIWTISR